MGERRLQRKGMFAMVKQGLHLPSSQAYHRIAQKPQKFIANKQLGFQAFQRSQLHIKKNQQR